MSVSFRKISGEILNVLAHYDHNPISVSIHIVVSNQDFDRIKVVDYDFRGEYEISAEGKIGEVHWGCFLLYLPIPPVVAANMPSTEDIQLSALVRDFANVLKLHDIPSKYYQIDWLLKSIDFNDRFADHPNQITNGVIRASGYIEGFYYTLQIQRQISLPLITDFEL